MMRRNIWMFAVSVGSIAAVAIAWWGIAGSGRIDAIFLPSPGRTLDVLGEYVVSGVFVRALAVSFLRIVVATVLAVIVGGCIGVLMGVSRTADYALSPFTQALRYLPITALLPLLVLWFGIGETMKIIFLFVGIVFYFIPLVQNAIRSVPTEYLDVARSFGARRAILVTRVYWPFALPQVFDGLIVINGIGWTYVILAEIVNSRDGIGYLLNVAGRLQRSDEVFAALILIAVVAIGFDRFLRWIRNRAFGW